MSTGGLAAHAGAHRVQARVWPRFASALTASALVHAVLTGIIATVPGMHSARTITAPVPSHLAVRLVASEERLLAALPETLEGLRDQAHPAPLAPKPPLPRPAARAPIRKDRQEDGSAITVAPDTTYYAARQLDQYPEPVAAVDLTFPADFAHSAAAGYVLLLVLIDADGSVNDASVVEAAPAGVFDEEAKRALLATRFKPALKGGRPVRSRLVVHVSYGKPD